MAQVVVDALTPAAVASKVTVYIGDLEVTDTQPAVAGEGLTATRFFTFGGSTIATETVTGGGGAPAASWALLLGDGQGSAQVSMALTPDATQASGLAPVSASDEVLRNAYEPYGAVRGGDNLATSRGWLGQVSDADTGLVYLNARYYDPALGRFLSPDPLFNPASPKTLDPYRYADNNPVMATDASGLAACYGLSRKDEQACMTSYNRGTSYEGEAGAGADSSSSSSSGGKSSSGTGSGGSTDLLPPGASFDVVITPAGTACAITAADCLNRYKNYDKWLMTPLTGAGVGDGYWHPTFNEVADCGPVKCRAGWALAGVMGLAALSVVAPEVLGVVLDEVLAGTEILGSAALRSATREAVEAEVAAAKTARGLSSLSDVDARASYLAGERQIAARNSQMLEAGVSPELRAQIAFEARNALRTEVRAAMADRVQAAKLDITDPNLTWEQVVSKYGGNYDAIADAASRSRPSVNQQFGLEP